MESTTAPVGGLMTGRGDRSFEAVLALPPIDTAAIPSYRLVSRSFGIVLAAVLGLVSIGLIAMFTVEISMTVHSEGMIEPTRVWTLRPQEPGLVTFAVKTGDTVHKGQVVAQMDTLARGAELRALSMRMLQAQADYDRIAASLPHTAVELNSSLTAARYGLVRTRAMLKLRAVELANTQNVDSLLTAYRAGQSVTLDQVVADVRAAEADILAKEAALSRAGEDSLDLRRRRYELEAMRSELRRATAQEKRLAVVSPADGIILTDELEKRTGAFVQAGDPLLDLAELRTWTAVAFVSHRDVPDVRVGQSATLDIPALDTLDGRLLSGVVAAVAEQPSAIPNASVQGLPTYRVVVRIDRTELQSLPADLLRRGYVARVRIVTRRGTLARLALGRLREQARRLQ
jgi:multidrug resistance efflux pump